MKESLATKRGLKRVLSLLLTTTMVTSTVFLGTANAYASDTLPYLGDSARGINQPYEHGYRTVDLKNWSSETDPFSESMRAQIPLQTRNDAFSDTQANPKLNADTQMFTLAGDYGNAFFDSYQYTNEFSQYLFNYWQYTDYYGSWHGMPTLGVPESMYVNERGVTDAWKNRKFEFGIINMPNPGYTNAAHKNGVKSIGCIFLPRTGQDHKDLVEKNADGKFPYADKLAEMSQWYGFDGWFINQEQAISSADIPLYKEFMKQMREQGVYIQWYDSVTTPNGGVSYQNEFNSSNSSFVKDDSLGQVSDSIFLNYWWSNSKLKKSADLAKTLGLDPLSTVFAGIEAGGDRWGQRYDLRNNLDPTGQPMNAIASLGSEFVHDGLDEDLDGGANNNVEMRREKDNYQWMTFQRERMWWTGMSQDPSTPSEDRRNTAYANTGIGVKTGDKWDGVSAYIAERSVINGDTFVTNFNTGHGLEYVKDGTVSNSHEWSNIVIQDILPTWQWWQQTTGTKMTVDFDYGSKYQKTLADKSAGKFDYKLVGAYNGGSSLVVSGKLDAENFLHLYKTDLDVTSDSKMNVTFKKTSDDEAKMKLGVIFADDPTKVVKLDIVDTDKKSDEWITSTVDFSGYAGKKIAAFGLVFTGTSDKYQMNVGEMKYTSGSEIKPDAPENFKIAKAYGTDAKEMMLTWDIASYDDVKQYNVYADINGEEMYMGGTYDSTFYIKSLYDAQGPVTIKLKAVSKDGTESDAAEATYDYSKTITKVAVTPTENSLNVSWVAPAQVTLGTTDVTVVKEYSNDTTEHSATSESGATTVSVPVTVKDGSRYTMTLTSKDSDGNPLSTVTYDGKFIDKVSAPYDGKVRVDNAKLSIPATIDWNKMYVTPVIGGVDQSQQIIVRGQAEMPQIDSKVDRVKVVLEDYSGNKSEEVQIPNCINVKITPNSGGVQPSKSLQLNAVVSNYISDNKVTWSVSGNNSESTTISDSGLLTVGADESASTIDVTVTSNENELAKGTATISILPATMMDPDTYSKVYRGTTQQIRILHMGETLPANNYTWSVSGAYGDSVKPGTTISKEGLLTLDPAEKAYSIIVSAESKSDPQESYSAYYTPADVLSISKTSGTYYVYPGQNVNYTVILKDNEDAAANYNWKVESGSTGVAKSEKTTIADGVLAIDKYEKSSSLKVTAIKKDDPGITAISTLSLSSLVKVARSTYGTMYPGQNATFTVSYQGTSANASDYIWSVESGTSGVEKSSSTTIKDGILTISADEKVRSFTITATLKSDSNLKNSFVLAISDPVSISGSVSVLPGKTSQFTSKIKGVAANASTVSWSVEGAKKVATSIDENGLLTVAGDESATSITVRATSKENPLYTAAKTVTVTLQAHNVVVTASGNGTVTADKATAVSGETIVLTVNPDSAYAVDTVTMNGEAVSAVNGVYSFTMPAGDATVKATFKSAPTAKAVTAFSELPSSVKTQSVAYGTSLTALTLPADLEATVNGATETIQGISWTSSPVYSSTTAASYAFTAVLPDGYALNSNVSMPVIHVTVAPRSGNGGGGSNNGGGNNNNGGSNNNNGGSNPSSVVTSKTEKGTLAVVITQPDSKAVVTGTQAAITATIANEASTVLAAASASNQVDMRVALPAASMVEQLKNTTVKTVELSVQAPHNVAANSNANAGVKISVDKSVLQAAKDGGKNVVLKVLDTQTGKAAYSWTFSGSLLKTSPASVANVDLAMSVKPIKDDAQIAAVAANNSANKTASGVVLKFANNGLLPAPATVRIFVGDQTGCTPNSKVYAYYFNRSTNALESLPVSEYTVDANGYITLTVVHCSDYVVLPKAATNPYPVKSDTTHPVGIKQGQSYTFLVTVSGNSVPNLSVGNGKLFSTTVTKQGNKYYFKVTANKNVETGMTALYSTLPGQKPVVLCYLSASK